VNTRLLNRFHILILTLCLLLPLSGCGSPPDNARVIEVIDGDTIIIQGGYRVRYIGIDAPEVHPEEQPLATEAWRANRQLVENREVRLEKDVSETDRYGRLLRYIWVDETLVNAELVRQGLARAKAYPPDTKYQKYLEQMEAQARSANRGIWAK